MTNQEDGENLKELIVLNRGVKELLLEGGGHWEETSPSLPALARDTPPLLLRASYIILQILITAV